MRCLIFIALIAAASAVYQAPYYKSEDGDAKANSYVIQLKDGIRPGAFATFLQKFAPVAVTYVYTHALNGIAIETLDLISVLSFEEIDFVEDDKLMVADVEWGMDRIDQRNLPLDGRMSLYGSGSGSHVYIVDTGLRHSHNEYGSRASFFWDYQPSNGGNDCHGHGTHCGGTTSGSSVGVAPSSSLYSVRVLNCQGSGSISDIIAGLDAIVAGGATPGRSVVSMSLSSSASSSVDSAVTRTINAGYTVSVAAGNQEQNACNRSPARHSNAITVGATDSSDRRASFSNFGSCVDLFGPGVNVRSASHSCNSCYTTMSGTSMACPHVSGIAAVHLGAGSCSSNTACRNRILGDGTSGVVSNPGSGSPNLLSYCG
ncbi:aqualysin-1-like [Ptychodera flava]|uniref:aqualysin-1-like n=1 Tax=Ptychodera flava TaxID=63121 RepID=UPI00396A6BBD